MMTRMRFATDASLGKLGRHLRAAGFDTRCQHQHRQADFFCKIEPTRIIVTRTIAIMQQYSGRRLVFVRPNDPWRQMRQVVEDMGIRPSDCKPFSRCLLCNQVIRRVERTEVLGHVPAYVWQQHQTFHACSHCRRTYWAGSHRKRMDRQLAAIFSTQMSENNP